MQGFVEGIEEYSEVGTCAGPDDRHCTAISRRSTSGQDLAFCISHQRRGSRGARDLLHSSEGLTFRQLYLGVAVLVNWKSLLLRSGARSTNDVMDNWMVERLRFV
jgi:hypothetical protein